MKPTIYLETSVISYYTSRPSRDIVVLAHQQLTREWWEKAMGKYEIVISEAVIEEAAGGDEEAASLRLGSIKDLKVLPATDETRELARFLVKELSLPGKSFTDAAHLAFASHHKVDFLITWNCRHIANGRIIRALLDLKKTIDIHVPIICTPIELLED